MKYRTTELLASTDLGVSGTKSIEVNVIQPISRIMLDWRITKASAALDMQSYAHKDIIKIELIDGSDVLHSLDGGQNQALCIFDRKAPTMNYGTYIFANSQVSLYGIDFGRHLWDPVLALDPTKFKNLQLKITWNEAVSDETASVNALRVWAECFDEKVVSPMGFLSARNFESWSLSAAAAYHYIDLPTDMVIRKMLIQGYRLGYEPMYQAAEARLNEDNDRRVVFDWDLENYSIQRMGIDPPVEEIIASQVVTSGADLYLTPTNYWALLEGTMYGNAYPVYNYAVARGGHFSLKAEATGQFSGIVRGWLPNHCNQFPFGDQEDIDDWYDVTKIGSLKLRLKSGSGTSGNVDTILQQLRKY